MNAITESTGRASLLDLLATPAVEPHADAPYGPAFDTLLADRPERAAPSPPVEFAATKTQSHSPQPASSDEAPEATEETAEATNDEEPAVAEVPDEDEEQPEDASAQQTAVVVAPIVLLEIATAEQPLDEPVDVAAAEKIAAAQAPAVREETSLDVPAIPAVTDVQPEGEPVSEVRTVAVVVPVAAASEVVLPVPTVTDERAKSGEPLENVELPTEEELAPADGALQPVPIKKRSGSGAEDKSETGRESDREAKSTAEPVAPVQPIGEASPVGVAGEIAAATPPAPAAPSDAVQSQTAASPSAATSVPAPGPRLAPELLAAAGSRPAREGEGPRVDSARLLTRVARAFVAAQDGDGQVRLRLSPAELGSLRLEVRVQDGVLVARMETETSAARAAIIDNLPALRERLAEQGVRIERFDVDLMQQQGSGTPDRPADRQPPEQPRPELAPRPRRAVPMAEGVAARTLVGEPDLRRLNVIV